MKTNPIKRYAEFHESAPLLIYKVLQTGPQLILHPGDEVTLPVYCRTTCCTCFLCSSSCSSLILSLTSWSSLHNEKMQQQTNMHVTV